MNGRTALYRHFDGDGTLLYVGITNHCFRRLEQHSNRAHWFGDLAQVTIEWHESREAALAAEALAITQERPMHNIRRPEDSEPARNYGWAVLHLDTSLWDGWYARRLEAVEMLEYFKEECPGETFILVPGSEQISQDPRWRGTHRNHLTPESLLGHGSPS